MGDNNSYPVPNSREVLIGSLRMGGRAPVVLQSMANTPSSDSASGLEQCRSIIRSGAQMVRFTTPGKKDVEALAQIKRSIETEYPLVPIVADVHFSAPVAYAAAVVCDKVRINPGNFHGRRRNRTTYSEEEYREELEGVKTMLAGLIELCKVHGTSLRIGVNHGSLSDRIMSRYGDTTEGMVESAMEFIRICRDLDFFNVVVSIKSSNTLLMVHSVRLLVKHMLGENLYFPLHLGVTESGDGDEGRVRSVVGIAPLLAEGFGDTIRVSLTESPENEIPVARMVARLFPKPSLLPYSPLEALPWNPFGFDQPIVTEWEGVGGFLPPVVISSPGSFPDPAPDIIAEKGSDGWILKRNKTGDMYPDFPEENVLYRLVHLDDHPVKVAGDAPSVHILDMGSAEITQVKDWLIKYYSVGGKGPVILKKEYVEKDREEFLVRCSGEFGFFLIDRLISGVWISNPYMDKEFLNWLSFFILQASRNRFTTTEYIACPSCGRTQFNIQAVLSEVRRSTSHLKGLKIAVMGCIVNGPGEMADADYGYIGSGAGTVSIYAGKKEVMKKVPSHKAVESLVNIIKERGDWVEP